LDACQASVDYTDLCCEADRATFVAEVAANRNQKAPQLLSSVETSMTDWSIHLSEKERINLAGYSERWTRLHGTDPNDDDRALFVLSQNFEEWAASSDLTGVCPTFVRPAVGLYQCFGS
jgi:hypothetical protein